MASESKPKPIKMDFTPNSFSNKATMGILPPPRVGTGSFPKAVSSADSVYQTAAGAHC